MLGVALLMPSANAHPDKVEDRLLLHFATGVHPIENGAWPDLTHKLTAKVQGGPKLASLGPAQALTFNGFTDWLLVAPDWATARAALPKRQFSVFLVNRMFLKDWPNASVLDTGELQFQTNQELGKTRPWPSTFRHRLSGGKISQNGIDSNKLTIFGFNHKSHRSSDQRGVYCAAMCRGRDHVLGANEFKKGCTNEQIIAAHP